jgi:hypothetical protein
MFLSSRENGEKRVEFAAVCKRHGYVCACEIFVLIKIFVPTRVLSERLDKNDLVHFSAS